MVDSSIKTLNPEQLQAMRHGEGPLLIIAGAGTGKTTVITERIKYLIIEKKISPSEVLALTFTEKAAREMEERVDVVLPLGYANMWISTFHSFADRILRDEAVNIGLDPHYRIMTQAENVHFLRRNLFKLDLDYFRPLGNPNKFVEGLLQHFSRLKDEDVKPNEYFDWIKVQNESSKLKVEDENLDEIQRYEELAKSYLTYEELKIKEGLLDFGDLIGRVLQLFRKRPKILQAYQQKFKYILIDEFQDTNFAQYVLVKLLAPPPKADLTVVGDDNQAIYRFRGAAISNILQFKKDYPKSKSVVLNQNYRSTQTILDAAYQLIKNNDPDTLEASLGISKKLQKVREIEETPVEFIMADRVENEAEKVANEVKSLKFKVQSLEWKDFAILVRANNHAEPFIRALGRAGIPYQFLGPGMLFRQPEVKDLIAYLSVLYNFEDSVAMYRLLSMNYFGLHGRDLAALMNLSRKQKISLFEAGEEVATSDSVVVSPQAKETITKLAKMIHRHLDLAKKESAGQILYYFLEDTGLLRQLADYKTPGDEKKAQNIAKFFDKLRSYEADHEDASVYAVVDFINLSLELGESPLATETDWTENDAVNILTVHSAKGLEFTVVFLVNLVSQRFPTAERREQIPIPEALIKEILPQGDYHLEEERRLFYVGMTRAKDRLFLTAANFYGEGKREKRISPFVVEALGTEAIEQLANKQLGQKNRQLNFLDIFQRTEGKISSPITNYQLPITYLSYSQIESFNNCPQQYKYRHVLRIPTPPSAAMTFGETIHETLRDFYQRAMVGQNPTKDDLLRALAENWSPVGYPSRAHEEKYRKEGEKILSEFFEKAYDSKNLPLALEQVFSVKVSSKLKVGGKIDRIDRVKRDSGRFKRDCGHGEYSIEIIDYKTGKSATKKDIEKDLQLTLYALAATDGTLTYMGVFPKTPRPEEVLVSFYFFDKQEKITSFRKKEDFELVKEELIKKAAEINQSSFSPTPGKFCDFCEFRLICEAWS